MNILTVYLGKDPRPPDAKKLKGTKDYSLRVGVYRILYGIDDNTVLSRFIGRNIDAGFIGSTAAVRSLVGATGSPEAVTRPAAPTDPIAGREVRDRHRFVVITPEAIYTGNAGIQARAV